MSNSALSQFLSLTDQLIAKLTEDIVTGVYLPGERLKEKEIALRFGISRAPLRETFRVLERNGLVEIMPWRGVRVVEPTRTEIKELFEARADLFALCARRIAKEGASVDLKAIQKEIGVLIKETNAGCDERTYKALTNGISTRMYSAINNRYLHDIMIVLRQKMFWHYCYLGTSTLERRRDSNAYWLCLSEALEGRDEQAAATAAYNIMTASKEFALQLLESTVDRVT